MIAELITNRDGSRSGGCHCFFSFLRCTHASEVREAGAHPLLASDCSSCRLPALMTYGQGRNDLNPRLAYFRCVAAGLIGRDAELAQLEAALAGAAEHGAALLVIGEAGIGKTSLLDTAVRDARNRRHRVLAVTGLGSQAQLPYARLHPLLHSVLEASCTPSVPPRSP